MRLPALTSLLLAATSLAILHTARGQNYYDVIDDSDLIALEEALASRFNVRYPTPDVQEQQQQQQPPSTFADEHVLLNYPRAKSGDDAAASLGFPALTEEQQKFGVNPGYEAFTADIVGDLSALNREEEEVPVNDEIAEDPFASYDKFPKKASLQALLDNPRVHVSAKSLEDERINDIYFTTIVAVSSALVAVGIVGAGFVFHRVRKNTKAAEDVEYPAYGVTGPGKETSPTSGDRKLAQNAQLYHYQHQKQQMIAFDSNTGADRRNGGISDNESEDGEEGDYTVYECPGLAPTGEMEVRNPMFEDDTTPKAGEGTK